MFTCYQVAPDKAESDKPQTPSKPASKPERASTPETAWRPTGAAMVELGTLRYRRGQLSDVRAEVHITDDRVEAKNIRFRPRQGQVAANFMLQEQTEPEHRQGSAEIVLKNADLQVFDDMLFEEPRNFYGSATGKIDVTFPVGEDIRPADGISGTIQLDLREGSFGKLGIATKLLSVLRTTEVIRLRAPTLRDEGLVYDRTAARVQMENGEATIDPIMLTAKSYAMEAKGKVNFPKEVSRVQIDVNLFESVTGIADKIPIIGHAVEGFKEASMLRLLMTGSPYDPTIKPAAKGLPDPKEGIKKFRERTESILDKIGL